MVRPTGILLLLPSVRARHEIPVLHGPNKYFYAYFRIDVHRTQLPSTSLVTFTSTKSSTSIDVDVVVDVGWAIIVKQSCHDSSVVIDYRATGVVMA
jgi:hypothetical protein